MNTIGVPAGGWAAIRFLADNPGISLSSNVKDITFFHLLLQLDLLHIHLRPPLASFLLCANYS